MFMKKKQKKHESQKSPVNAKNPDLPKIFMAASLQ